MEQLKDACNYVHTGLHKTTLVKIPGGYYPENLVFSPTRRPRDLSKSTRLSLRPSHEIHLRDFHGPLLV